MKIDSPTVLERELDLPCGAESLVGAARGHLGWSVWLDGRGGHGPGWSCGTLLAVDGVPWAIEGSSERWLERLDRRITDRRLRGGTGRTGILVLLAYEALDRPTPHATVAGERTPENFAAVEVDRSLAALESGRFLLTDRTEKRRALRPDSEREVLSWCDAEPAPPGLAAVARGPATSSLPRERYLRSVLRLKRHIAAGDIYQANLCQRIDVPVEGDPWETYRRLVVRTPAPRSAYVETAAFTVASLSPETFLRLEPPDRIETCPIKGTRARGENAVRDAAAARELLHSEKDRAELLMIVDLERNDLGRICRTGSVEVPEPHELKSFPAVHHLSARVTGRLREGILPSQMLEATFPGGSISGAPKIRARELLAEIEPVRRGFFTGSLIWFGDDGSLDSSILIRTMVVAAGRARIGAGGGIVADSEPEAEWHESNLKARAATEALGFDPVEVA